MNSKMIQLTEGQFEFSAKRSGRVHWDPVGRFPAPGKRLLRKLIRLLWNFYFLGSLEMKRNTLLAELSILSESIFVYNCDRPAQDTDIAMPSAC